MSAVKTIVKEVGHEYGYGLIAILCMARTAYMPSFGIYTRELLCNEYARLDKASAYLT